MLFPAARENVWRNPLMKFETYLLLGALIFFIWKTRRAVQSSRTPQERYFALRSSIFTWFIGFLLMLALLFLPNKARVLLVIPIFFGWVGIARYLRDTRTRLRREAEGRVELERMKRVN